MSFRAGMEGFALILFKSTAVASSRLICGGAMFDSTGSHELGVGLSVPETIRMVVFSATSTLLV